MRNSRPVRATSSFTAAFALTVSLFALWGMGHRLYDMLLPQLAGASHLQSYYLALAQSLTGVVYFFGAIPAAFYARRFGAKAAILFGLGCICIGSFTLYPAAEIHTHGAFLFAVAVITCGWIFLEVAANPLAASLGPDETFVQRLNFAQAFHPLGALAGIYVGQWLVAADMVVPHAKASYSIAHPYIVLGAIVLLIAFLFEEFRFPQQASVRIKGGEGRALRTLVTQPLFLLAIAAQFFSVVILVSNGVAGGKLIGDAFHHYPPGTIGDVFLWAAVIFAVGRFAGCALMRFISPARLLAIFACGGIACSLIAAAGGTTTAAIAVLANQFFASIVWPTVLGLGIRGSGSLMKPGTALICMGGAAGGIAYQLMSATWPFPSAHLAILVPAFSFAFVLGFALAHRRAGARAANA